MNFNHTEDRRMLSDMLTRFVAEQYGFAVRDRIANSAEGYSMEFWQRYAELGAIGALFDEANGGFGGHGFDIAVVFEALGRGLVVEPFLDTLMAGDAIAAVGTSAQKDILESVQTGATRIALAHTEPQAYYELAHVDTYAVRNENGWTLNGHKAVVAQAEHADVFVVSARTSGDAESEQGITLFLIPATTPGLHINGYPLIDGGRAADITLRDLALRDDAVLGTIDQGYATLERSVGKGVLALCAEALGAMDAARDATLDYLQTRKQFGVPIGRFQALQHRMADVLLEIEQVRSAVINAAAQLDHADRITRERALSAAKYTIGRVGTLVAEECIQLHGGIGMTWELPLAHYAKRLIMIDHQLGDEDHHLNRYIALANQSG
ncbi:acyl-CoA dehydrogenase family protein [Bordetella genomosp. 4]|uniref:Pimeloyl-CoA dehydrogenase small subunit n=1 Tax=Bordetella genomosp. 4 TaxID=463044 RepID=A0A261TZN4_9BORD|nr:acyl-CoA dehydrogenase family protein [Bordetella genomosp. 4]OZI51564.1 pimeloyl-CoA dehydrogenase small subunit [Bordetella genomosp. 4]OZI54642.1 pimeloyl-CoA dehydrogenase small subunit [Bordetella genomosp. 4]